MQVNQLEHFEAGVGSEGYHTMTQDFKVIVTRYSCLCNVNASFRK